MPVDYTRFVIGYHGCDAEVARDVLLGDKGLRESSNAYDWLGRGIYFWEYGPARARDFAVQESIRKSAKISDPDVLGAYIHLGNCFDLLDVRFTAVLKEVYPSFKEFMAASGEPLPVNSRPRKDGSKLMHGLDCAVIEFALRVMENRGLAPFDTVRGAFWEGGEAFPGAEIQSQSHIQIAVRNPECIHGYFRHKSR